MVCERVNTLSFMHFKSLQTSNTAFKNNGTTSYQTAMGISTDLLVLLAFNYLLKFNLHFWTLGQLFSVITDRTNIKHEKLCLLACILML